MSEPFASTLNLAIQQTPQVAKPRNAATDAQRAQPSSAKALKDSVSLSADVKNVYQAQQSDAATARSAPAESNAVPARSQSVSPTQIRDLSIQMRRLSSEATQNRAAEQSSAAVTDASANDPSLASVPLSDTLTADDKPQTATFTPLADAPQASTADRGADEENQKPSNSAAPDTGQSETTATSQSVDSAAGLANLDHAVGRIVHGRSTHGANFESLTEATRHSVRQRESLAVAHSESGGQELANATAQIGRTSRAKKEPSPSQAQTRAVLRENKTYTRAAQKA